MGTGSTVTLWATATDNIEVTSADVTIGTQTFAMTFVSTRWEYDFTAPLDDDSDFTYSIEVFDAAGNSDGSATFTITVTDDVPPTITNVQATPSSQIIDGYVNITATITDNIALLEKRIIIIGPTGFPDKNESMLSSGGGTYYYNVSYDIAGVYQYHIWAKDTSENQAISPTYQFDIFAELIITTTLPSWNFISVPFNQTITKTNLFIRYEDNDYTWSEAAAQGFIISAIFYWNRTDQIYDSTNILNPGEGYWMYAYYECEIWATELGPMVTDDYITSLKYTWNIIGLPTNEPLSKTSLSVIYDGEVYNWTQATTNQNPTNSPLILSFIYDWIRSNQIYEPTDSLNPGYAYWMYAYEACILKQ